MSAFLIVARTLLQLLCESCAPSLSSCPDDPQELVMHTVISHVLLVASYYFGIGDRLKRVVSVYDRYFSYPFAARKASLSPIVIDALVTRIIDSLVASVVHTLGYKSHTESYLALSVCAGIARE